jgi:hydroxypyruvate reductase
MNRSLAQLRADALAIWQSGVDAVDSQRLVAEHVQVKGGRLLIGAEAVDLAAIGRILVVGGGKAGAGMAAGLEQALGPQVLESKRVTGWLNVPADCLRPLRAIHLHAARPAGVNEPTAEGVAGADKILELVGSMSAADVCICLISGGGSALLPAPITGISLADKLAVTRHLSAAGANIAELNRVRRQLSRIKGGGLARACPAGRMFTLIISDVLGDPLDLIASGPTIEGLGSAGEALEILERYGSRAAGISRAVFDSLRAKASATPAAKCRVTNLVIGNNALAVDAAGQQAEKLGYTHALDSARSMEGPAEEVGQHLARMALTMRSGAGPQCLVTGGEPVVRLVAAAQRGRGGRNQQMVLAGLEVLAEAGGDEIVLLSGGTDGEDGPTDAAGAWVDADVIRAAHARQLDPHDYLLRNDAYTFFDALGSLIKTGPTHTNVCDLRVVLVNRPQGE